MEEKEGFLFFVFRQKAFAFLPGIPNLTNLKFVVLRNLSILGECV